MTFIEFKEKNLPFSQLINGNYKERKKPLRRITGTKGSSSSGSFFKNKMARISNQQSSCESFYSCIKKKKKNGAAIIIIRQKYRENAYVFFGVIRYACQV